MEIMVYCTPDSNMNRRLNVKKRGEGGEKALGAVAFLCKTKESRPLQLFHLCNADLYWSFFLETLNKGCAKCLPDKKWNFTIAVDLFYEF
jgi:hypothetical protein